MYNIFFGSRRLCVCASSQDSSGDPNAVLYSPRAFPELSFLPDFFDSSCAINSLYVPVSALRDGNEDDVFASSGNEDDVSFDGSMSAFEKTCMCLNRGGVGGGVMERMVFERMFGGLNRIEAGGGLVTNGAGKVLLIYRYGKWDLPKGTREPGESFECTALREVEEECGIGELSIDEFICCTYHTFRRDGLFNLKCTNWFRMSYSGLSEKTVPQLSESIERAEWVAPKDLPRYLSNTYPNILEVFGV